MDRLTREEIAGAVARGYCTTANMYKELDADLVTGITNEIMTLLQSLSQEAVREEALDRGDKLMQAKLSGFNEGLEEAARMCERHLYGTDEFRHGARTCIEAIVALKREPNAAAQAGQGFSSAPSHEGHAAGPAPAAPDVASMVKRLRERARVMSAGIYIEGSDATLMFDAAALLAKLGQGWIPVSEEEAARTVDSMTIFRSASGPLWYRYDLPSLPPAPGASDE